MEERKEGGKEEKKGKKEGREEVPEFSHPNRQGTQHHGAPQPSQATVAIAHVLDANDRVPVLL